MQIDPTDPSRTYNAEQNAGLAQTFRRIVDVTVGQAGFGVHRADQLDFIFGLELQKKAMLAPAPLLTSFALNHILVQEHFYENVFRSFEHMGDTKWEPLVCFCISFPLLLGCSIKFPKVTLNSRL